MTIKSDFVIRPERSDLRSTRVPWIVKVSEIPSQGVFLEFSDQKGDLNEALSDILGTSPHYKAQVSLKASEKIIILNADMQASMALECGRCAEDYKLPISKKITIAYYRSESDHMRAMSEDLNDIQGSFDLEFLDSNEIDVGEVVHEQMALEIPFQPLCKSDCKGLCPACGANFNETQCDCAKTEETFSPFHEALKAKMNGKIEN